MQINRTHSKNTSAFFIDRDGVIIKIVRYPSKKEPFDSAQNPKDVKLVPNIDKVILWLNQQHIPVIEISNQPGVAKGKMSQKTSDAIETKTHYLLKKSKCKINYVYICPHHPQGIVPKLTKICSCRKPKPGLLIKASKDLNINLNKSIFLGDSTSDIEAGKKAGCSTFLYFHHHNLPEKVKLAQNSNPDFQSINHLQTLSILKKYFS